MFSEKILEKSNKRKIKTFKMIRFFCSDVIWFFIIFTLIYNFHQFIGEPFEYILLAFVLCSFGAMGSFLYIMLNCFSPHFKIKKQEYLSIKNKTYQLTDTYVTDTREHVEVDDDEDGTTVIREKIISFQGLPNTFITSVNNNFQIGERVVVQTFQANVDGQISYPVINAWRY